MVKSQSYGSRLAHAVWRLGGKAGTLVALLAMFFFGYVAKGFFGSEALPPSGETGAHSVADSSRTEVWTCSMHPQVQLPEAGACPICGMDLIRVVDEAGGGVGEERRFETTEAAKALMGIQTSPVERRFVPAEIRMTGKVDYDETKLGYITAWVAGRLDRLYVDYTGVQVKKGDHMVYLYSPELLAGQDELLRAADGVRRLRADSSETLKQAAESSLEASRNKLRRWGLTDAQIKEAEKTGISSEHITVYAPMGGTVIEKMGHEGMYVKEGTRIYTIADLSKVWLLLDAYESDLPWLHLGQTVEFSTEAYPGEPFTGKITFIDPVLDRITRTVKVRVNVPNEDARLKPEMFARAIVRAQVATGGRVMDPGLAGKWIGPMHPEIVKDGPGTCDICGMALVKAEDLGYVPARAEPEDMPLVIPASAALLTGKRAVVYVEVPGQENPTYEGREIVLGPRTGEYYIVREGLREGERVVTHGNFKIDSALQILAKPSMMSPEGGGGGGGHKHGGANGPAAEEDAGHASAGSKGGDLHASAAFQGQLRTLFDGYLGLHSSLASDGFDASREAAKAVQDALDGVDMGLLEGAAHGVWMESHGAIKAALAQMREADGIEGVRTALAPLTAALSKAIAALGVGPGSAVYELRCPMALDNAGANWLQAVSTTRNPYFGASMLSCGSVVGRIDRAGDEAPA